MSDEYNYGPLEHEMTGGTFAENDDETIPCGLCGTATRMKSTKRCDPCWELEHRIQDSPELARQILATIEHDDAPAAPERGEWRVLETITCTGIVNERGENIAKGLGRNARQRREHTLQIITGHNQHATLITQRERLLRLLRPVTSPTACYCAVMGSEKCWHCEARELITAIEQDQIVTRPTTGREG